MKNEKLWALSFGMIIIETALYMIAAYVINPSMTEYLMLKGFAFELTGIITSILSWVAIIFRPFSGVLSDRFSKKKLIILSYVISIACMFGYYLASSPAILIVIRIIHGFAFTISGTMSMTFAVSFVPEKRIGEGISYFGIASLIGSMMGPNLGVSISDNISIQAPFLFAIILYVICILLVCFIPYKFERKENTKLSFNSFIAPELFVYMILIGVFSFGNGIVQYYIVGFGKERNIANISMFFTVYSLTMLLMKPFVGKLQDRYGAHFILYPSFFIYGLGVIILAKSYTLLPVLIAAAFKAFGQGNGSPAIQADSVKKLGMKRSGVALSTTMIGQDIGNALGPIFASSLINVIGYEDMFLCYATILFICLIIYFVYRKVEKRKGMA